MYFWDAGLQQSFMEDGIGTRLNARPYMDAIYMARLRMQLPEAKTNMVSVYCCSTEYLVKTI